ncbi:DUF4412 domain-containing protein [Carboxylicivirga taeanensis]|uniref:DUF4412 domain-containing protein n=1 Tax=Carboxylicivirga taeanensis TaxID=1416875 RepID=UPI003F6E3AC7
MRKIGFLVFILFLAFTFQEATCQSFIEKMAKKAAKKAEKKTEEKVEKETEKQLDSLMKGLEPGDEADESGDYEYNMTVWAERMAAMGYSGDPVPIEDAYAFTSSMTMKMNTYDPNGKMESDGVVKIYSNPGAKTFAYAFVSGNLQGHNEQGKGMIIMDMENKATIIINDEEGEKTGLVYGGEGMADGSWYADELSNEEDEHEDTAAKITKTGRTKTILGYRCEEYQFKDENSEGWAWITRDLDWKSDDFMSSIFKSSESGHGILGGFLMASEQVDLHDGEKSTFTVTEINKKEQASFTMSDYQLTNLGAIKIPTNEATDK